MASRWFFDLVPASLATVLLMSGWQDVVARGEPTSDLKGKENKDKAERRKVVKDKQTEDQPLNREQEKKRLSSWVADRTTVTTRGRMRSMKSAVLWLIGTTMAQP